MAQLILNHYGAKLCKCCKQRKPIKGGTQNKRGWFVCAECKERRLARTAA